MIFFLPVVLVVLIRLVIMPISQLLDKWEYYPFNTRVMAYSCRLFFSRAVAMFTLVTSIYHRHQGSCWEDHFCDQMLALVVADFIVDCLLALVIRFPRVLLSSLSNVAGKLADIHVSRNGQSTDYKIFSLMFCSLRQRRNIMSSQDV